MARVAASAMMHARAGLPIGKLRVACCNFTLLKYKLIYSLIWWQSIDTYESWLVRQLWDTEMMVGSLQVLDGCKAFLQ